jgi:uncharacterized membrane protein YbhN (UPF0104 family)
VGERLARIRNLSAPEPGAAPEERPGRRRAVRLAGLGVVVALAVLAARHTDLRAVGAAVAGASPGLLLLAGACNVLSLAAHTRRWMAVVRTPGHRLRFRDAFSAVTAGFALGVVVPARAGDVLRAVLLSRHARLPVASVLAAAVLDYVVGAATLVPLLALLALVMPLPGWAVKALVVFGLVSAVGTVAAWLLRPPRDRQLAHPRAGLVARIRGGLAAAHEPGAIAAAVAWGLCGWGAEVLIAFFALEAVGLQASLPAAGLAVVASTAANVVAISPGNTGPFEVAVALALIGLGAPREQALAFALMYHLAHLVPVGLIGGAVLLREARQEPAQGEALPDRGRDATAGR